jgi:LPXTG-motif cell wall-anchored protein
VSLADVLPAADQILATLSDLPLAALYATAGVVAAVENIFPPFPSDVVAAFAVFLSARQGGPFWAAALVTWAGNVGGAMLMYAAGRRYGSLLLLEKLERYAGKRAAAHLQTMHARYGLWALFLSRFLPGVRAVVPPFAGAMKLPAWHVFVTIGAASAFWYALISYLAYLAGERWEVLLRLLARSTTLVTAVALGIVLLAIAVWVVRRRRRRQRDTQPELWHDDAP